MIEMGQYSNQIYQAIRTADNEPDLSLFIQPNC